MWLFSCLPIHLDLTTYREKGRFSARCLHDLVLLCAISSALFFMLGLWGTSVNPFFTVPGVYFGTNAAVFA